MTLIIRTESCVFCSLSTLFISTVLKEASKFKTIAKQVWPITFASSGPPTSLRKFSWTRS
jgi:hypothetical protein